MDLYDIYDKAGLDGSDNSRAWTRLPTVLKYFITSQHKTLIDKVKNNVVKEYGEKGLTSLVKSSGFRAVQTNNRHNGVIDSLHLFGLAVDFLKVGIFKDKSIPVCCDLQCIDSGVCWHIQYKRG